ncbi:GNAT family N-acetyltransferase [Anaerococcus hydrogenalis]|uniref:N-acetyltransferase n=1 Tax=Anaerococcus hydrogenalis TaxID=33029 RepID=A0A2N6UI42_9FIRM|nr:GNAT family N-acetyltransferase [Anaerococcus hydrogenalis]MBS5988456.1 GNAT family N-acetyltransferase [Anaerococcus hydrogenalis]MDK7695282.1 GNAT family N-acetyltransferase [Anaerococcus hydrogenalis]MDK7697041.1 GNAT family N-acetyltransferase [Anaerococcus hydrogenalis]MDK7708438.1 GNAT family N-acetyltransferase [Anaerococcus hydrogenalis]PMC81260.1 N-acetyltransferase [Anaerococcus hydrogenalis]
MNLTLSDSYLKYLNEINDLYIEAFPKAERKPMDQIIKVCQNGYGRIIPILMDDEFVGMFITLDSDGDNTLLIDYFAIKSEYRGLSLGSKAIELLNEMENKTIIIEIEPCVNEASNLLQRQKRKKFYENLGFRQTDINISWFGVDLELMSLNKTINFNHYMDLLTSIFPRAYIEENIKLT